MLHLKSQSNNTENKMPIRKRRSQKKEYDNTNQGALWISEYGLDYLFGDSEKKSPIFNGTINVNGDDCKLSAWMSNAGEEALSDEMLKALEELAEVVGKIPALNLKIELPDGFASEATPKQTATTSRRKRSRKDHPADAPKEAEAETLDDEEEEEAVENLTIDF